VTSIDTSEEHDSSPRDRYLHTAERQLRWYARSAWKARIGYQTLEVFQIGTGAVIPLAAAVHWPTAVGAALGACIAIAGGIRSVFRWQANWVAWSITAGKTQREISLYQAGARPYDGEGRGRLLVENVEDLALAETLQWASNSQKSDQRGGERTQAPSMQGGEE
jgi:hypothetical protein